MDLLFACLYRGPMRRSFQGWKGFKKDVGHEAFPVKFRDLKMSPKDINTKKKPVVLIDKSLDFFNDKILFPKKLEKANEMLQKVGLPKVEKKVG